MDLNVFEPELKDLILKTRDFALPNPAGINDLRKVLSRTTKGKALSQFGNDLTQAAKNGNFDPVIGRDTEIEELMEILCCRRKNNPALIGDAGVGKTAIVEGMAQRIADGQVPENLKNKRLIALNLSSLVAGTIYRGEFEERIEILLAEIERSNEQIILFIDELHTIVGAGAARGTLDAANMLKPALARGDLRCIGATTFNEYYKYIEKDAALERRFQTIQVNEPSIEDTIEMLQGVKEHYKIHHSVQIQDDAIIAATNLSKRYLSGHFLPDGAFTLVDRSCARLQIKKEQCLTKDDIAETVAKITGIPVQRIKTEEKQKLLEMEMHLRRQVIGQDKAVSAVSHAIRRAYVGIRDMNRPIGSFLFMGPTGVGKTHLAKSLAEFLFDDANAMVRIDMSEYMEKHTVSRLIGAPPGYIGHDEGGQLTDAVRRKPYCVILLDEVEKACPEVFHVFLQVLDDGRMTDGQGRTVDFKNTVIIMTSNIGSQWISEKHLTMEEIEGKVKHAIQEHFSPEFLNRIDEPIIFGRLGTEELKQIVTLELAKLSRHFTEKELTLKLSESAKEKLVERGFDEVYGARPLRRIIQRDILNQLAILILKEDFKDSDTVVIDLADNDEFRSLEGDIEQRSLTLPQMTVSVK